MYIKKGLVGITALAMVGTSLGLSDADSSAYSNSSMIVGDVENQGNKFRDIIGHWAEDVIQKWIKSGVIEGISDTDFGVESAITRADLSVLITRILGIGDLKIDNNAIDIESDAYYSSSVNWAIQNGGLIVENGLARPNDYITREEAAHLLYKAFNIVDSNVTTDSLVRFKDIKEIDKKYEAGVESLVGLQMLSGDTLGYIHPKKHLKRGECIQLIDNILGNLNKDMIISGKKENRNFAYTENDIYIKDSKLGAVNRIFSERILVDGSEIKGLVVNSKDIGLDKEKVEIEVRGKSKITDMLVGSDSDLKISDDSKIAVISILGGVKLSLSGDTPRGINNVTSINISPDGVLKIGDKEYVNKSEYIIRFSGIPNDSDINERKELNIEIKKHIDNRLEIEEIEQEHKEDIKERGIVGNEFVDNSLVGIPTYKVFGVKYIKQGEKEYNINQDTPEKWCYRAYVVYNDGRVEYSEPIFVDGYNYDINMRDGKVEVGADRKLRKEILLDIVGSNIPIIVDNGVQILSGIDRYSSDELRITKADMIKEGVYRGIIEYNLNEYDEIDMDKYYGYRVVFKSDVGEEESKVYPLLVDKVGDIGIKLKRGLVVDKDIILEYEVSGDRDGTGRQYGIKYKKVGLENNNEVGDDWEDVGLHTDGGIVRGRISGVGLGDETIAVVGYCKVGNITIYSDISTYNFNKIAKYNGKSKIELNNSKDIAKIRLGIDSNGIDLGNSEIRIKGKGVERLEKLDELGARYRDGYLVFDLKGLRSGEEYNLTLRLKNEHGISDDIVVKLYTK